MKLYKIRDWDSYFENNRSRYIESLTWVAIPNKHQGEHYSKIITHQDGAIIFAAWVLIIQVASKCRPRGVLVRDDGTPLDTESLSLKTRAPKEWFETALSFLECHTNWLDTEDVAVERQASVTSKSSESQMGAPRARPIPSYSIPSEEGCGEKQSGELPTEDQAVSMCAVAGVPEGFARFVYADWFSRDGRDAANVKVPFARYAKKRWVREQKDWQNGTHKGNMRDRIIGSAKTVDRNAGTLQRPQDYAHLT